MRRRFIILIQLLCFNLLLLQCAPPPVEYASKPSVVKEIEELRAGLIALLPEKEQQLKSAKEEAAWLAATSYKAGAGIARVNGSYFPGWLGNWFVNMHMQERGLCWHYQQDLFKELRRRKLKHFALGTCMRDKGKYTSHSCVYITTAKGKWPHAWVVDPWMWNGRSITHKAWTLDPKQWTDEPFFANNYKHYFPEEHQNPVEFWLSIRCYDGVYRLFSDKKAFFSEQYNIMRENVIKGQQERNGNPINY